MLMMLFRHVEYYVEDILRSAEKGNKDSQLDCYGLGSYSFYF